MECGRTADGAPVCCGCCRGMPEKYPAGRGALANRVLQETRAGSAHVPVDAEDTDRDVEEGAATKCFYDLRDLVLDIFSSFAVIWRYIARAETLLACCMSVGSVLAYREWGAGLSVNMNWTLVSFGVIFPLSMSISNGFKRRDEALRALADLRGTLLNVMVAHAKWDWVGAGKELDGRKRPPTKREGAAAWEVPEEHAQRVHNLLRQVVDAMREYLLVPRAARARATYTTYGADEARWILWAEEVGGQKVTRLLAVLHDATEALKQYGMPEGQSSRLSAWLTNAAVCWERVRVLKEYRTPQAMRSFTRVFVHCLPVMYGPYFLYLAQGADGSRDNAAFAACIACLMSAFMMSLFFVQTSLENPFDPKSLDTVKVDLEMGRTQRLLDAVLDDRGVDWRRFVPTYPADPASVTLDYAPMSSNGSPVHPPSHPPIHCEMT